MRGSRATFLDRCRCGSVLTMTCSSSASIQVSCACGFPVGIKVTTVARLLRLASRVTSTASGIAALLAHTDHGSLPMLAFDVPPPGVGPARAGRRRESPDFCLTFGVSYMIEYTFAL